MEHARRIHAPQPRTSVLPGCGLCLAFLCFFLSYASIAQADVNRYVNSGACPAVGTGTLQDPYCRIQDAIVVAQDGDVIRVASGIYVENINFLGKAIAVLGNSGADRPTISGPPCPTARVVTFNSGEGADSVLANVTITGGVGGILCANSSPTIDHCVIENNRAETGGGIELFNSNARLIDCDILNNTANNIGGGINCTAGSDAVILRAFIRDNIAAHGAGIYISNGSSPSVWDCEITGNIAGGAGGGIVSSSKDSQATIERCLIAENRAAAGAGINCGASSPRIIDCTITNNISSGIAGGINCKDHASPTITRCLIEGNVAENPNGGGIECNTESSPVITDCIIRFNRAGNGGGLYVRDNSSPVLRRCIISDNIAQRIDGQHGSGGGLVLSTGNPIIDQCVIERNEANDVGGISHNGPGGVIMNSVISSNRSSVNGGGILCNNSSLRIENCLIENNDAVFGGGGLYNFGAGNPTIINCAFLGNSVSGGSGGAVFSGGASFPSLTSSILWENFPDSVHDQVGSTTSADYSDIQGGWSGTANLNVDPQLEDSLVADHGPRLRPSSPCINAGDPATLLRWGIRDLDGHARVLCGRVDMGAYEFGIGDLDCDRSVTLSDFAAWSACETASGDPPYPSGCESLDYDFDGAINLFDFARFQRAITSPQ